MNSDFNLLNDGHILEIPESVNYWLVRADGGKYYHDFLNNHFIAIADNEITLEKIKIEEDHNSLTGITIESYKNIYDEVYKRMTPQQISHAASRTLHFIESMQINDLVLVPSHRSTDFLLGIIESSVYEASEDEINKGFGDHYAICDYKKRRKIKWIKIIKREAISEKMYWILSAHQSIFKLNDYAEHVDKLLSPIYIKGNRCYAVLKVNTRHGISLTEWLELYNTVQTICGEDSSKIIIKSNVQSPGLIDFITNIENLPTLITAFATLSGVLFTKVQVGNSEILGIIPYFFNEGRIRRTSMKLDNELKEVELEMKKEELRSIKNGDETSTPAISRSLEISSFNAGNLIEFRRRTDNSVHMDEDGSDKQ